MSKIYFTQAKKSLRSLFALCLLLVVGTLTAQADPIATLGKLELDKAYEVGMSTTGVGSYTATEDGVLKVSSSSSNIITAYSDAACTQQIEVTNMKDENFHAYYYFDVTAGTTYYFSAGNVLSNITVTLSFSTTKSVTFTGTSVAAGTTINCTANSQLSFYFDNNVSCSGVSLVYADNAKKPLDFNTNGSHVFFEVKEAIYNLMNEGKIKAGDAISFVLTGVTLKGDETVKAGEDGTVSASFVCGKKPVALVSATNFNTSHTFRSFWTKGNEDGIVTLTFDGDIQVKSAEKIKLTYGDFSSGAEASDRYTENPPYTVSGNVLTIDLTDKERTPALMLGTNTIYDKMLLQVSNLCDTDGNPVYTTATGSTGSFTVQYPYEITNVDAAVEFTPESGSSLANVDNVTLFIKDYEKFSYDAARFSYLSDTKSLETIDVAKDKLNPTADTDIDGAYTLTIPVPEDVKAKKDVYLTLTNLKAANGKNYQSLFTAKYNGFTVQSMTYQASTDAAPQEMIGAELDSLVSDQPITIKTNYDANVGTDSLSYVAYSIEDLNPVEGDDAFIVTRTHVGTYDKDAQVWKGEVVGLGTTKLLLGHTYRIVVNGYQQLGKNWNPYKDLVVGSDTLYIYGTQADYVYSDINLESVEPTTITSADDFNLTVTYDGMVKIVEGATCIAGGGGSENMYFDTYTPIEPDDDGYSNQWKLGLSESNAKSQDARYATVNIAAEDVDGRRVKGNFGDRATSVTQQELFLSYNGAELTVTPETESTVSSISYFDVTTPSYIGMGSLALSEATLVDRASRKTVAVVDSVELIYSETVQAIIDDSETLSDEAMKEKYGQYWQDKIKTTDARLYLSAEITEPGTYIFSIPDDYFTSGFQFESENTRAFMGYYYIEEAPVEAAYETTPANGSFVQSLSKISIVFTSYNEIGIGSGMISISKDGKSIGKVDAVYSDDQLNQADITVDYTDKGVYTFEVPEGYFLDDSGEPVPAFTLTYTIADPLNFTADPANGSTVEKLDEILITLNDYAEDSWNAPLLNTEQTLKVMKDGEEVCTAKGENNPLIFNMSSIKLSQTLTEKGIYTIVIPDGYYTDDDINPLPGFTLVYGIGVETGINAVKADTANGTKTIYNINGIRVNGKLPAGVYIVNGKKVVVK